MSRVEGEPAFVLHRRAWRDTSLIVELFSTGHGRIGAVARGARNPRSGFFGLAEPFRLLEVSWTRRGEMATLTGLEPAQGPLRLNGRALWCGLYANELLLRLTPRDDPEPRLFDAYAALLPKLSDAAGQADALRRFELALLHAVGVAPDLSTCGDDGEPVLPDGRYRVEPDTGPVRIVGRSGDRSGERPGFSGRLLLALSEGAPIPAGEQGAALRLMRQLIERQLDGRRLHTPSLFRENRA